MDPRLDNPEWRAIFREMPATREEVDDILEISEEPKGFNGSFITPATRGKAILAVNVSRDLRRISYSMRRL